VRRLMQREKLHLQKLKLKESLKLKKDWLSLRLKQS
jgi:hypothetical protein